VNVDPPSDDTNGVDGSEHDTKKSDATPVVRLIPSDTLIVHTMLSPARDGDILEHDKLEAFVGFPCTTNEGAPLVIAVLLLVAATLMANVVVMKVGVAENTKVDPPSAVLNAEVDDTAVDDTEKSDATPVVAPVLPDTLIVHTTLSPMRDGNVLVHARLDAVVG
jgi:hypothetical protein